MKSPIKILRNLLVTGHWLDPMERFIVRVTKDARDSSKKWSRIKRKEQRRKLFKNLPILILSKTKSFFKRKHKHPIVIKVWFDGDFYVLANSSASVLYFPIRDGHHCYWVHDHKDRWSPKGPNIYKLYSIKEGPPTPNY